MKELKTAACKVRINKKVIQLQGVNTPADLKLIHRCTQVACTNACTGIKNFGST